MWQVAAAAAGRELLAFVYNYMCGCLSTRYFLIASRTLTFKFQKVLLPRYLSIKSSLYLISLSSLYRATIDFPAVANSPLELLWTG